MYLATVYQAYLKILIIRPS